MSLREEQESVESLGAQAYEDTKRMTTDATEAGSKDTLERKTDQL